MAFHQWLNSTSSPQPTSPHVANATDPISELSPLATHHHYPLTNEARDVVIPDAVHHPLDGHGNFQSANKTSETQIDGTVYADFPRSVPTNYEKPRPHPTMRLSHLEHVEQAAEPKLHSMQRSSSDYSRRKYHELMQQSTSIHLSEQMSKTFVPGNDRSRDHPAGGRPIMAATHPANYGPPARRPDHPSLTITRSKVRCSDGPKATNPPMLPMLDTFEEFLEQMQTTSPLSATSFPNPALPNSSPVETPWPIYSDPMHQTSFSPDFPEPYCSILRSDRRLEPGNVISPTYMIALPCGGMVEMAYHYPSKETLETTLKEDTGIDGL